jgi:hypothetical protein
LCLIFVKRFVFGELRDERLAREIKKRQNTQVREKSAFFSAYKTNNINKLNTT